MQVWAGSGRASALLGAGGAGQSFGEAFTEACSREAPMPYPQHSYRQLVPIMSGILGQSLRHDLSSRWKWAKKSGIRARSCTFRGVDLIHFLHVTTA